MKVLLVLAALAAAACAVQIPADAEIKSQFESFKLAHGKKYASVAEEQFRHKIFKDNVIRIAKHNARYENGEVSFKVGVNKFADMHLHEMVEARNGLRPQLKKASEKVHKAPEGPWPWSTKVDWRSSGYVTPIKDQGQCGSCWSFSATGALEGQLFKKYGQLVSLSEQNLVDCSYANSGCNGGLMDLAFQYIADNNGIDSEASYPYTAQDGICHFSAANVAGNDTGYIDVNPTEKDLAHAVQTIGPISVAMDASLWSFNMYAGGIYDDAECGNTEWDLDHGVLAVGFGSGWTTDDYWVVKNSWGAEWGENGYFRIARNKNNLCGLATMASYPTV